MGRIRSEIPIATATTRHLRVLESAGLVRVEKRGRERVYRLDRERLVAVAGEWLGWFHTGERAKKRRERGRPG